VIDVEPARVPEPVAVNLAAQPGAVVAARLGRIDRRQVGRQVLQVRHERKDGVRRYVDSALALVLHGGASLDRRPRPAVPGVAGHRSVRLWPQAVCQRPDRWATRPVAERHGNVARTHPKAGERLAWTTVE
jgi:hypothetical protein